LLLSPDMTKTPARPSSLPMIDTTGLAIASSLKSRVVKQLRRALAGVRTSPVHIRVSFADVNGPKGGLDVRCAIDVSIPQTAPLHVEKTAEHDVTAFDRSAAMISRQIAQQLGRRRESGRRPKKYYAARRCSDRRQIVTTRSARLDLRMDTETWTAIPSERLEFVLPT
jgi:ribosome hibernation promoting factor